MKKDIYIAAITEIDNGADHYGGILTSDTPQGLCAEVERFLKVEEDERHLGIRFDPESFLPTCTYGNGHSLPEEIEAGDGDVTFVIHTSKVTVEMTAKVQLHNVTEVYDSDGNVTFSSKSYTDPEKAKQHLRDSFDDLFSKGDVNRKIYPGMFSRNGRDELCDGNLEDHVRPDHVTVWDGQGCSYEGKIDEQEIEL